MEGITFITGNADKLKEYKQILEEIELKPIKLDLEEIQSMELEEIVTHKLKKAYEYIKEPVFVEDVGFFIEALNGLPGPFIKFFQERLGPVSAITLLGNNKNRKAKAVCCIGFYDGKNMFFSKGEMSGNISHEVRGDIGFGFDYCLIPEGHDKTVAQLGMDFKNKNSHRAKAIEQFKKDLHKYLSSRP